MVMTEENGFWFGKVEILNAQCCLGPKECKEGSCPQKKGLDVQRPKCKGLTAKRVTEILIRSRGREKRQTLIRKISMTPSLADAAYLVAALCASHLL